MIRREELQEEIRRYQLDPVTYASIAKLADLITVYNYLFPEPNTVTEQYSGSSEASDPSTTMDDRKTDGSEFLHAAYNMDPDEFMQVMDELMDTLHIIQPRLYDGVMRKLY
jgi:hypothetical protein